jgi:hypothetical protein
LQFEFNVELYLLNEFLENAGAVLIRIMIA